MSSPQLENGFTQIANEILDALCRIRIPGEARQVLDFIIRKTYGFHKKDDQIALSQFVLGTGLSKAHICHSIKKLSAMNMIYISEKGKVIINSFRFNKDFGTWKPLPKKETLPKKEKVVAEKGNKSFPKKGHTKDNNTKDNKIYLPLSEKLKGKILSVSPEAKIIDSQLNAWANDFRLMVEQDKRTVQEIETLIEQVFQNDFWKTNIRSAGKLRQQWNDGKMTFALRRRNESDFLSVVINAQ